MGKKTFSSDKTAVEFGSLNLYRCLRYINIGNSRLKCIKKSFTAPDLHELFMSSVFNEFFFLHFFFLDFNQVVYSHNLIKHHLINHHLDVETPPLMGFNSIFKRVEILPLNWLWSYWTRSNGDTAKLIPTKSYNLNEFDNHSFP